MEGHVDVAPDVRLWVQDIGDRASSPLLLVMGANASGLIWPDRFLASLAEHHHVIRYDHRDTGRSTWAFDDRPYAVADLAGDAVAVLDALGVERAHVVGMSMGGTLVQLLLLDHPERLLSATVVCTSALRSGLAPGDIEYEPGLPDPDPRLLALWERMADSRDREAEIAWRVEHWRLLNGEAVPFDAETFRRLEEGAIDHAGRHDNPAAHARAAQTGLDRGAELAGVRTPTLVIEAPQDPINPPPHPAHLARAIPGARLVTISGMGHALSPAVLTPLAEAILSHTRRLWTAPGSPWVKARPDPVLEAARRARRRRKLPQGSRPGYLPVMKEIAPGLWHWTARHPKIHIEVSSYFLPEHALLLDPLVPPGGLERLEELERPREILLTNRHHWRDCGRLIERFGCTVRAPRVGMHEFSEDQQVEPYDFGDSLAGGAVTVHEVGGICPDESALHVPTASALAVADGVIHYGALGFVPDDLMDDPEDTKLALKEAYARLADELEFENLLTAHGVPVVGGAREALRDFAGTRATSQ